MLRLALCVSFGLGLLLGSVSQAADFQFHNDETIALIGDALIEQEQYEGWIELAITTSAPDKNLKFRNLGWSGDTPVGQSRFGLSLLQAGREPADEGWKQLLGQVDIVKPTLVVFGYGMASSLDLGEKGVEQFRNEYVKLIDALKASNPNIRFVFLSPIARSDKDKQAVVTAYANAIKQLAEQNSAPYVDLTAFSGDTKFHQDPVHLNSAGYKQAAEVICQSLGLQKSGWETSANAAGLRAIIDRKNQWWFNRSRPANMAYVFGFRKHEQGQNAVEIPQFDVLIAQEETTIAKLRDLKTAAPKSEEARTESKYAKFTQQPTPEFTVGEGLEVKLWAENPQLNKPIHMNFDAQGRLWVASSEAYPMIEVGQSQPDKIVVLEDTTGAGHADKATVFADGLLIPTGVLPGDGGVYVAQSTDLLFLKDNDGDGKADEKRRVLSGFGTEDTHHNLHTLLWGPDGRLYMNQSVYTRTDAETPFGVARLKAGGGFRMNSDNLRTQVFFRGLWNPWGHSIDKFGNSFLTDGAGFEGIAYTFPGASFNPTPNARRQLELISPGRWPKFASEEIIYSDSFPKEWQGSIVTCDFRANRVTRFSLNDRGAGFVTKQEDDLLRTAATTFRPIDIKQGPDGALYIADWSNPIINHGEVDFRDARRDRWHGRIWRVSWKDAAKHPRVDLAKATTDQLYSNLLSNDRYTREQSRRVLIERGQDAAKALAGWTSKQKTDEAKLQGLWMHQALNAANPELLVTLISSQDANVRSAAVRVLSDWASGESDVDKPVDSDSALKLFGLAIGDKSARVRLEAIRGLSLLKSYQASKLALAALDQPMDNFTDYALWLTVNENAQVLSQSLNDDAVMSKLKPKHLEFVMSALEPSLATQLLANYLAKHQVPVDGSGPWIELIGKAGDAAQLSGLFSRVVSGEIKDAVAVRVLSALAEAHRIRGLAPSGIEKVAALLQSPNAELQAAAAKLIGQWKLSDQIDALAQLAANDKVVVETRRAAIAALRQFQSADATDRLVKLVGQIPSGELSIDLLSALAATDLDRGADAILKALAGSTDERQAQQLWRAVLNTKDAGNRLAPKLAGSGLSELAAQAGLRVATEGRQEAALVAALVPLSGQLMTPEQLTPARIAEIVKEVAASGDAHRGEKIYRRSELACATCHAIGGVGGKVGPDMTSLGASAPVDYIIESLFLPNAKIKEGFHSSVLATEDGQIITGIEVSADEAETVIRTSTNELVRIPTADIVEKKNGVSLMPSGIVDRLPHQDQLDLIKFISSLGKQGDFDASRSGVARRYDVLSGTHVLEQAGTEPIINGSLTNGWQPLQTYVNGTVDKQTLLDMTKPPTHVSLVHVYLRARFDTAADRSVSLHLNNAKDVAVWVDGQSVKVQAEAAKDGVTPGSVESKLGAGKHTVLIRLDAQSMPEKFLLMSSDVTFAVE